MAHQVTNPVNILTLVRSSATNGFGPRTGWFLAYLARWESWNFRKLLEQELHSSRMHTARLLTVSPIMHCAGGVCLARGSALPGEGGSALQEGGLPCQGGPPCQGVVCLARGGSALPGGVCLARGVLLARGSPCQGVCLAGGGIPACTEADPSPLWTESQTPVKI